MESGNLVEVLTKETFDPEKCKLLPSSLLLPICRLVLAEFVLLTTSYYLVFTFVFSRFYF